MQSKPETIVNYYDSCESDYRQFWDLDRSLALHAGYWDSTTKTLTDALEKENEVLAQWVQVRREDHILDAGCGVGGSSIYLASKYGCRVTGITLSSRQVDTAMCNAEKRGVSSLVSFEQRDFCRTGFPDASFDVVWGLESVCHAKEKVHFVREAYRLLKPGGRLIVADGFARREHNTAMQKWLNGWGVETLETVDGFHRHLSEKFGSVEYRDITPNVLPSSRRLYWISFPAWLYSRMGELAGARTRVQTDNIRAAYYQYTTLKKGLWEYGIFLSKKGQ